MFRRSKKTASTAFDDGRAHCDLCRAVVPVEDGNCDLGHRLQLDVQPAHSPEAPEAEVGLVTPPAPGEAASPPPSSPAPEERPPAPPAAPAAKDEDPFAHPYDEVLAWDEQDAAAGSNGAKAAGSATAGSAGELGPEADEPDFDELVNRGEADEAAEVDDDTYFEDLTSALPGADDDAHR